MSRLSVEIKKQSYDFVLSYCPLKILKFDITILQMQYLKTYKSLRLKTCVSGYKIMSRTFGENLKKLYDPFLVIVLF